jgi:hypothetical protein
MRGVPNLAIGEGPRVCRTTLALVSLHIGGDLAKVGIAESLDALTKRAVTALLGGPGIRRDSSSRPLKRR